MSNITMSDELIVAVDLLLERHFLVLLDKVGLDLQLVWMRLQKEYIFPLQVSNCRTVPSLATIVDYSFVCRHLCMYILVSEAA
jgi:hypothetical protein